MMSMRRSNIFRILGKAREPGIGETGTLVPLDHQVKSLALQIFAQALWRNQLLPEPHRWRRNRRIPVSIRRRSGQPQVVVPQPRRQLQGTHGDSLAAAVVEAAAT